MRKIVVGVDGSEGSKAALAWAIDEAKMRGDAVVALHAWDFLVPVGGVGMVAPLYEPEIDLEAESKQLLANVVKEVTGGDHPVAIYEVVRRASTAQALIDASKDADLLVIGSRGLGGFKGLLLGSTGQQCAHHSHCPLVIIPHGR